MSGIRRVIAGVSGSPGSLQALRYAVDLAEEHQAGLIALLAWSPPGGELADRRHPSAYLRQVWVDAAWERLWSAMEEGLGGGPAGVAFEARVLRGEPASVLVGFADCGDVLVVGAGRRGQPGRMLSCHVSRYCVAHARCPVIAVPPSVLAPLDRGLRGWALRHRRLSVAEVELNSGRH